MDWFWENIVGVITTVLAVYGAVLSSLNFWHTSKRDKKELCIEAEFKQGSFVTLNNVTVTVINKSLRPITIKKIGLEYDPFVEAKFPKPVGYEHEAIKLPIRLEISDQFYYHVPCCYLANQNEKANHFDTSAIPYAIDNEGQKYKGTPLKHPVFIISDY